MYIPYVYVIGWEHLDMFYIGVKYSAKAHPDLFWVKYFTSSKYVNQFRKDHGEPNIVKIIRRFDNKDEAVMFEKTFIAKHGCVKSENWLNKREPGEKFVNPGGWKQTEEWRKWASNERKRGNQVGVKRGPQSEEHRRKIGMSRVGKIHTAEAKQQMKEAKAGSLNPRAKAIVIKHCSEVKEFDTFKQLADYLGVSRNVPGRWFTRNSIPKKYGIEVIRFDTPIQ